MGRHLWVGSREEPRSKCSGVLSLGTANLLGSLSLRLFSRRSISGHVKYKIILTFKKKEKEPRSLRLWEADQQVFLKLVEIQRVAWEISIVEDIFLTWKILQIVVIACSDGRLLQTQLSRGRKLLMYALFSSFSGSSSKLKLP